MPGIYSSGAYGTGIITNNDTSPYNPAIYSVAVVPTVVNNGSGVDIDITVTNLTSGNQPALAVYLDTGWGSVTGSVYVTDMWYADPSFKHYAVATGASNYVEARPSLYDGGNYGVFGSATGLSLAIPTLVIGNSGKMIGISTTSSYSNKLEAFNFSTNYGFRQLGGNSFYNGVTGFYGPIDHLSSGETRNWQIFLRTVIPPTGGAFNSGSISGAIAAVQPYIDWYRSQYPDLRPPKVKGRVLALQLSVGWVSGARGYEAISGISPDTPGEDWNSLLAGRLRLSPSGLKALGFYNIMFWNIAGTSAGQAYIPSVWENLPDNLKRTAYQIDEWSKTNGIDIGFWVGSAYSFYQAGDFDSILKLSESPIGVIGVDYNIATASGRYITDEALARSKANIDNGVMVFGKIVGLDGGPSFIRSHWFMDVASGVRASRPGKVIFTESYHADLGQNYIPTAYYPYYQWDQQRCPLLDKLLPNYQNFIIINSFDFPSNQQPSGAMDMLYLAESKGLCPIIFNGSFISSLSPPTGYIETTKDYFAQTSAKIKCI